jgi:hypothetical protein
MFFLEFKGHESKIYGHFLQINAGKYTEINPNDCIITGQVKPVDNTIYDLRGFVLLGDRISSDTSSEDTLSVYYVVNEQNAKDKDSDFKLVAT